MTKLYFRSCVLFLCVIQVHAIKKEDPALIKKSHSSFVKTIARTLFILPLLFEKTVQNTTHPICPVPSKSNNAQAASDLFPLVDFAENIRQFSASFEPRNYASPFDAIVPNGISRPLNLTHAFYN